MTHRPETLRTLTGLKPWINPEDIHATYLSANPHPNAVQWLLDHPDEINWPNLSLNPSETVGEYVMTNLDTPGSWGRIHWRNLCKNNGDWAVKLLLENPDAITYANFAGNDNPAAIKHLQDSPKKHGFTWPQRECAFAANVDDWATTQTCEHYQKCFVLCRVHGSWMHALCLNSNPMAVELLRSCPPECLPWDALCMNSSKWALHQLLSRPDKLDWTWLAYNRNPDVVDLFESVARYAPAVAVNWQGLSQNPAIFRS